MVLQSIRTYSIVIIFSFLLIHFIQLVSAQNDSFDVNYNEGEIVKLLTQDLDLEKNQTELETNQSELLTKVLAKETGLPSDIIIALVSGGTGGGAALLSAYIGHHFSLKSKKEDNRIAYKNSLRTTRIEQYSQLFNRIKDFFPFEEHIKTLRQIENFKSAIYQWYLLDKGAFLMGSESATKYNDFIQYLDTLRKAVGTDGTLNNYVELNNYFEQFRLKLLEDVEFRE